MSTAYLATNPPRCVLINQDTSEVIECQFNPAQLVVTTQVNYTRFAIPGLSHQPLQYQNTGNRQCSSVEFMLDALASPRYDVRDFMNFMDALTVPPRAITGVEDTAPPRVLLIWPSVITLDCVVTQVQHTYRLLYSNGSPRLVASSITFEEMLDVRITAEDRRIGDVLTAAELNDVLVVDDDDFIFE